MIRGQDHLSVKDQMEDLRERMRLLQGDRKVYPTRAVQVEVSGSFMRPRIAGLS